MVSRRKIIKLAQLAVFFLVISVATNTVVAKHLERKTDTDALETFSARFSGFLYDKDDGFDLVGDFSIVKRNNHYFGISNLDLYCGTEKLGIWEKKLSSADVSLIMNFIEKLDNANNEVYVKGYINDHYLVEYNNESWKVKPDKSIFNQKYSPNLCFYTTIFKDEIEHLRIERKKHVKSVDHLIVKKWFYDPATFQALKVGSTLSFSSKPINSADTYWEIDVNFNLNASSKIAHFDSINTILQYHAEESVTDYMYLSVYYNDLLDRTDDKERVFRHHSFYIKELTGDVLVLQITF